ncbi:MAG: hypothetical protein HQ581_00135 [Planctomycetes bacterium]|nr:hypothetical protein [Planctomycetota bacterium]
MNDVQRVVCRIVALCAFVYGLVRPLLMGTDDGAGIAVVLGDSVLVVAIVAVLISAGSAATVYIMVRVLSAQSTIVLLFVKLVVFALSAHAAGVCAAMVLIALGVFETGYPLILLGLSATSWLCGGLAGLAAMRSIPEYKQLLEGKRESAVDQTEEGKDLGLMGRQATPCHPAAERKGRDMNTLEKVVYLVDVLCAFAYGFVKPLLVKKEAQAEIAAFLGDNMVVWAVAVILSPVAFYLLVRGATNQRTSILLGVKLLVVGAPAVAAGLFAAMVMVALGLFDTGYPLILLGFSATSWLCAGLAGLAAMRSTPEYKQLLKTRRKSDADRTAEGETVERK